MSKSHLDRADAQKTPGDTRAERAFSSLESTRHWVFAYGSNMDLEDLGRWLTEHGYPPMNPIQVCVGVLRRHTLVWDYFAQSRDGGAANCAPGDGDLPGLLIYVDDDLLRAIDHKEGKKYFRSQHEVDADDGPRQAWVYRVYDRYRQSEGVLPRKFYRDIIIRAARRYALPTAHIEALKRCACIDDEVHD